MLSKLKRIWKFNNEFLSDEDFVQAMTISGDKIEIGYYITQNQLRKAIESACKLTHCGNAQSSVVSKIFKRLGIKHGEIK